MVQLAGQGGAARTARVRLPLVSRHYECSGYKERDARMSTEMAD